MLLVAVIVAPRNDREIEKSVCASPSVSVSQVDGTMRAWFAPAPLPIRDWHSPELDPALVMASFLRAHTLLVADLEARFADAGLPALDVARLLWLWAEHTNGLEPQAIARKLVLSPPAVSRLVRSADERKR